jgi:uncharacterized protein (DUF924 family)
VELPDVVFYWYGTLKPLQALQPTPLQELWTNKWFAKGDAMRAMDAALHRFAHLMPTPSDEDDATGNTGKGGGGVAEGDEEGAGPRRESAAPLDDAATAAAALASPDSLARDKVAQACLLRTLGRIILCDQVSRNIFRRTARAYATDPLARQLARPLLAHVPALPIQCQLTLVMVLVHSEDAADQAVVVQNIDRLDATFPAHAAVLRALRAIAANHSSRVATFGRFPERNKYVGRPSSDAEAAFLAGIYPEYAS